MPRFPRYILLLIFSFLGNPTSVVAAPLHRASPQMQQRGNPATPYFCKKAFPEVVISRRWITARRFETFSEFEPVLEQALARFWDELASDGALQHFIDFSAKQNGLARGQKTIRHEFIHRERATLHVTDGLQRIQSAPIGSGSGQIPDPESAEIFLALRPRLIGFDLWNFGLRIWGGKDHHYKIQATLELVGPQYDFPGTIPHAKALAVLFQTLGATDHLDFPPVGPAKMLNQDTAEEFLTYLERRKDSSHSLIFIPQPLPHLTSRNFLEVTDFFAPFTRTFLLDPSFATIESLMSQNPARRARWQRTGMGDVLKKDAISCLIPHSDNPNNWHVINSDIGCLPLVGAAVLGWSLTPAAQAQARDFLRMNVVEDFGPALKNLAELQGANKSLQTQLEDAQKKIATHMEKITELERQLKAAPPPNASPENTAHTDIKYLFEMQGLMELEIAQLSSDLSVERGQRAALNSLLLESQQRVFSLVAELRKAQGHKSEIEAAALASVRELFPLDNLEKVIRLAALLYQGRLFFLPSALASARKASKDNPVFFNSPHTLQKTLGAFAAMVQILHPHYYPPDDVRPKGNPAKNLENSTGYSYAPREDSKTHESQALMNIRLFEFEGENYWMTHHIGFREGKYPLRINFAPVGKSKLLVVGHVGDHLPYSGDGRRDSL